MNRTQKSSIAIVAAFFVVAALASPVLADTIAPAITFGVIDDDFNGTPDEFSSASLAKAVYTRFDDKRAFAEFDLSGLGGPVVETATITGTLEEKFTFGFGTSPADIQFDLYSGNGAADLSDFDGAGTIIGTLTVEEDFDTLALSFDVADALQALVDGGATHAGLRVRALQSNVGQVDVVDLALNVTAVPEPTSIALIAAAGLFVLRRR